MWIVPIIFIVVVAALLFAGILINLLWKLFIIIAVIATAGVLTGMFAGIFGVWDWWQRRTGNRHES